MVRAIERGLVLQDFESLTFGMVLGFITTYNNIYDKEEEPEGDKTRTASQADFDRF